MDTSVYKYQIANPLVNTISIFGILKIEAIIGKNKFIINEPFALNSFNKSPIIENSYIFLNDFLDAIGDLIYYRMNDSIRKLITLLESYLEFRSIKGNINCPFKKHSRNPPNFMSKVFELCNTPNEFMCPRNLYSEILKILYILYKLRNKIIHEGVHLDFFDYVIAHKAIIAYYYIFNSPNNCVEIRNYALNIYLQYLQITGLIAPSRLLNNADFVIGQSDFDYFKNTYEILEMPSK